MGERAYEKRCPLGRVDGPREIAGFQQIMSKLNLGTIAELTTLER